MQLQLFSAAGLLASADELGWLQFHTSSLPACYAPAPSTESSAAAGGPHIAGRWPRIAQRQLVMPVFDQTTNH